ncbi:MAG: hypothetical protein KGI54_17435 [Pseudomonadota bacterium]|nr:hypothetical protein [Pseudomonadota bacterium]
MAASTLAALDAHTTPAVANQGKSKDFSNSTPTVTGQWLFDRFMVNDDSEVTKLGIVRHAVESVDTATFKTALKDFVELAKATNNEAKLKTARNHQSVLRVAYGALKFCMPALQEAGYSNKTGYHEMAALGRQVLSAANLKWDGSPAPTDEEREKARKERQARAEEKMLMQIMKDNPRQPGQTIAQWQEACLEIGQETIAGELAKAEEEAIDKAAKAIIRDNPDIAAKVAERVLALLLEQTASE